MFSVLSFYRMGGSIFTPALHGSGSLGVEHLYEQAVAGHISAQMFGAQVVLGLAADHAQLGQAQQQLAEAVQVLGV